MRAPTARPPRRRTPHPCPAWYALLASAAWPAAPALAEPSDAAARWAALEGEPPDDSTRGDALPPLGAFAPGDPQLDLARFRADPRRPLTVSAALERWRCAAGVEAAAAAVADLERLCRGESALACEVLVALEAAVPAPERGPCGVAWTGAVPCRPEAALAAVGGHLTPSALRALCGEGETARCEPGWREGHDHGSAAPAFARCAAAGSRPGGRPPTRRGAHLLEHLHRRRPERRLGQGPGATPPQLRGTPASPARVGSGRGKSR